MSKRHSLPIVALLAVIAGSSCTYLRAQGSAPAPGGAQIISYDSDITVNHDSTLLVRETIAVSFPSMQNAQGIYRDIATHYNDQFANPYVIHFEVVSLERDGQPEDFYLRKTADGLRIYLGKSGEIVPPGEHTYELTYTVDRELGDFPDHDELYWNVTGNGWILPIQKVTATVHFPQGIAPGAILLDAYTGRRGSAGSDFTASMARQGNATYRTTRALAPSEGMSIVARWPKGFVSPITDEQRHHYFLEDHQAGLIILTGLIVLLIYYIAAWFLGGRGPARREDTPGSEPPRGLSPAALRYFWRMDFDQKAMVADLVDLAVKKQLAILDDGTGAYILGRLKPGPAPTDGGEQISPDQAPPQVTADEKLVLDRLFAPDDTIRMDSAHRTLIGGAVEALHHHLRFGLEKFYFVANSGVLIPGLLISLATLARCGYAIQGGQGLPVLLLSAGLLPWSLGGLALAIFAIAAWRNAFSDPYHPPTARKRAIVISAVLLLFLIGEVAGLGVMLRASTPELVALLLLMVAINYLFYNIFKAPNRSRRALVEQIENFRMFLATTEPAPRDARTPPKISSVLFEKFLPYAMALNVEKAWGEKFATALGQAAQGKTMTYSPAWYSGPAWNPITASTFATTLANSFSSAISSAMRARVPRSGRGRR
jgi:hypothetical protein